VAVAVAVSVAVAVAVAFKSAPTWALPEPFYGRFKKIKRFISLITLFTAEPI